MRVQRKKTFPVYSCHRSTENSLYKILGIVPNAPIHSHSSRNRNLSRSSICKNQVHSVLTVPKRARTNYFAPKRNAQRFSADQSSKRQTTQIFAGIRQVPAKSINLNASRFSFLKVTSKQINMNAKKGFAARYKSQQMFYADEPPKITERNSLVSKTFHEEDSANLKESLQGFKRKDTYFDNFKVEGW